MVQLPDGNPLNTTLPVAVAQVGCVMVPTVGALGVAGCALTVLGAEAAVVQAPNVAVTVYVPAGAVTVFPETTTPVEGLIAYVYAAL
ncbi:hypothetical protein FLGE108171_10920 [Flavobacterium gelidilacus]